MHNESKSNIVTLMKLWVGAALILMGVQSAQASVQGTPVLNLTDVFSKAMLSPSTLSKTKLSGLRLVVGALRLPDATQAEELRVNFDDNRFDVLTENMIFANGSYGEFDSPSGILLEPVSRGSFCSLKAKRGPLEAGPLTDAQIRALPRDWTFPEGDSWKVDPYMPAAMRTQDLGEDILLRLAIVPPPGSVARKEVRIDEILCQVQIRDLENAEAGLQQALEGVLGPWVNFSIQR